MVTRFFSVFCMMLFLVVSSSNGGKKERVSRSKLSSSPAEQLYLQKKRKFEMRKKQHDQIMAALAKTEANGLHNQKVISRALFQSQVFKELCADDHAEIKEIRARVAAQHVDGLLKVIASEDRS